MSSKWLKQFFFLNVCLCWGLGLLYFRNLTIFVFPENSAADFWLVLLYCAVSLIGHLGLLALAVLAVTYYPLKLCQYKTPAIAIASFGILTLIADILVYQNYHFHLHGVFFQFALQGQLSQFFNFTLVEMLSIVGLILFVLSLEMGFARLAEKLHTQNTVYWTILGSAMLSYSLYFLSASQPTERPQQLLRNHAITLKSRVLPYYMNLLAKGLPEHYHLSHLEHQGGNLFRQPKRVVPNLQYPLKPLRCHPKTKPNIIMIVIDTWRFDMLNQAVMPNLSQKAEHGVVFTHHASGGNATIPGLFSLLYSLPPSYWQAAVNNKRRPVFLDILDKNHYRVKAFSSSSLAVPPIADTLFHQTEIEYAQSQQASPADRDKQITHALTTYIQQAKQPFFSFLLLDTAHGYCDPGNYPTLFSPAIKHCKRLWLSQQTDPRPYINRYKNAVHSVDARLGEIFATLDKMHIWQNTILVITGDHGEEFNDNHKNYWGHASNYSRYQVQTPLIVIAPKQKPMLVSKPTTHYDVVPTLLQNVFNCTQASTNYSVGENLFSATTLPFMIVGSYVDYALLDRQERITAIYPSGNFVVYDKHYTPMKRQQLNITQWQQAGVLMTKYYKRT